MEHFLDDRPATREIRRVLRDGGAYVVLLHIGLDPMGRLKQKLAQYIYPRFRPLELLGWLRKKLFRPIHQPIQTSYTADSARACLGDAGLEIHRVISTRTEPRTPLVGPHVLVLVARR